MKTKILSLLSAIALCLASFSVQAALTCTAPTSTGFSTAYNPTQSVNNATQGTVNFTCTRTAAADATSVLVASNTGLNPTGTINRASSGTNRIQYSGYRNSTCTGVLWTNWTIAGAMTVTLLPILTTQTLSVNFWGCITLAGQAVPAGTYTDSVRFGVFTMAGASLGAQPTFNVSITNPATCAITSVGNVAFGTYIAMRATPLVAPTANIVLNCTSRLPYSMALDANSGVVAGLNYSLTINAAAPPVSSRGTGPGQTHTLGGTMPANQAGTCATGTCAATQTRTLTITY